MSRSLLRWSSAPSTWATRWTCQRRRSAGDAAWSKATMLQPRQTCLMKLIGSRLTPAPRNGLSAAGRRSQTAVQLVTAASRRRRRSSPPGSSGGRSAVLPPVLLSARWRHRQELDQQSRHPRRPLPGRGASSPATRQTARTTSSCTAAHQPSAGGHLRCSAQPGGIPTRGVSDPGRSCLRSSSSSTSSSRRSGGLQRC
jgi:hypothetical protein